MRRILFTFTLIALLFGPVASAHAKQDRQTAHSLTSCLDRRGDPGEQQSERSEEHHSFGRALQALFHHRETRKSDADDCIRLNEIQALGTHNSYHIQPSPSLDFLLSTVGEALMPGLAAVTRTLAYTHLPLAQQFSFQGVRQIELDVYDDPGAGGLYAKPLGPALVATFGLPPGPAFDPLGRMLTPGLKTLHVQEIDFRSTCLTLVDCLVEVRAWSNAHPGHVPIMVLIEAEDTPIPDPVGFGFVVPPPFGLDALNEIDTEIRTVFSPEQLITPDDVRGDRATLEDAVLLDGWPTLDASRGRILFTLDNGGSPRDLYIQGHPSLAGRVMFTNSSPGEPEAAFLKLNDPISSFDAIQQAVAAGYVVRTRADADTAEARSGDTTRRDAALASGAQWVSTDYPTLANNPFGTGYFVEIPDGSPARCNPISAPADCKAEQLEGRARIQEEEDED